MNEIAIRSLPGVLALMGLAIIWLWLVPSYFISDLRQRLFALRDELFDVARNGQLCFDDDAYTTLRSRINGMIRFGHRLDLVTSVLFILTTLNDKTVEDTVRMSEAEWQRALDPVDKPVRDHLNQIKAKMLSIMLRHLLLSIIWSPLAWMICVIALCLVAITIVVTLPPMAVRSLIGGASRRSPRKLLLISAHKKVSQIRARIDGAALEVGQAA